jgi:hypothetical protein
MIHAEVLLSRGPHELLRNFLPCLAVSLWHCKLSRCEARMNLKLPLALAALFFYCAALCAPRATAAAGGKITWKQDQTAQLNIEGHVPITWNVYTNDKRKTQVIILLGHRYLALDLKTEAVYELDLKDITKSKDKDQRDQIETDEPATIGKPVPSSDWSQRDVGPAEHIVLTLDDYSRKIDLELPHPLNIRLGIY